MLIAVFVVAVEGLVEGNQQARTARQVQRFVALEHGEVIFIAVLRRGRRCPPTLLSVAIDGGG